MLRKTPLLLLALLWMALVGCQPASPSDRENPPTEIPPAATPTNPVLEETMPAVSPSPQTPAVSALVGTVISASDVAGQPDIPLEDQLVLVIPASSAAGILDLGDEPLSPETLRFLHAEVSSAGEGVSTTRTGAGGSFNLPLDPGDYVLCLADAGSSADFPASTRGCGLVTVPIGVEKPVEISSGFGEILIHEP